MFGDWRQGCFQPSRSISQSCLENKVTYSRKQIEDVVRIYQNYLNLDGNKFAFLMALAGMETSFGENTVARFEYSYSRNSISYKRSSLLQDGYKLHGDLCACSWSPWQILWIVAVELGWDLKRDPNDLNKADLAIGFVVKLLNRLISQGANTPALLFGCWNGGVGFLKRPMPDALNYSKKAASIYESLIKDANGQKQS